MSQNFELGVETTLLDLVKTLKAQKETEEFAKKIRIEIEEEIAALIPTKDSEQSTFTLGDGSKVTVKRGLNYKADPRDIIEVFSDEAISQYSLPIPIVTKVVQTLDIKGYEWYRKNHPLIFQEMAEFVTVAPKKVAVTLQAARE
jgi:methionine aminopeptidase